MIRMKPRSQRIGLALLCALTGCATLESTSQKVRISTEPTGANVAVLEPDARRELGPSPVEYERRYDSYRCSKLAWLIPVGTTLLGGGAGFGLAYATTMRPNSLGQDNRVDAGEATGAIFSAIGLAIGIAIAAECRMKDGVVPGHYEERFVVEAQKDGFLPASAPLKIPSELDKMELVLPPAPAAK